MAKKTREEVMELCRNWAADPCWDLEDTEGFEDHRDDLIQTRQMHEDIWAREWQNKWRRRANDIGFLPSVPELFMEFIMKLEDRIEELEKKVGI